MLLARYSGEETVAFGVTVSGRPADLPGVESMIGCFINTLPTRVRVREASLLRPWLADLQLRQIELRQYEYTPLITVQSWSAIPGGTPLFESILVFENHPVSEIQGVVAGALRTTKARMIEKPGAPLVLMVLPGESLSLEARYDRGHLAPAAVGRLLDHFANLLCDVAEAEAGCRLGDLSPLGEAERHAILVEWNPPRSFRRQDPLCLDELIAEQVERSPEAVAVNAGGRNLTYGALDTYANSLAARLRGLGIGPEAPVAIAVERSLEMMVGLLAILKAGGTYVPLDPGYPTARLSFMLEDSGAQVLLSQRDLVARLPFAAGICHTVCLDAPEDDQGQRRAVAAVPPPVGVPDRSAYIIYTSGSTGHPKGAINTHRAICNRLLWMQEAYGLAADDRVLQKTPISFDVSVWELFWPLLVGARLVLAEPGAHRDPAALIRSIVDEEITTLHFVPSMLRAFLAEPGVERCGSLRRVMASGEALPPALERSFFSLLHAELHNLYGPTEAAVDVTAWPCDRAEARDPLPIGRPISNVRIHLLGAEGLPVPLGVPGELAIGGVALARGYHRRPELTAARFQPDPLAGGPDRPEPGARLYRTGDLARFLPDGALEFLGRRDHQVKLRGFRIELGEIESLLETHPAVREAVVLVREERVGDARPIAYVAPKAAAEEVAPLRAWLARFLPEYMVPALFVGMEVLPQTPSGKVDRSALARIQPTKVAERGAVLPGTPEEELLAAIWADVLGSVARIGPQDDFFLLGGHSLLAMSLVSRLRESFGVELPLRVIFEASTLSAMAERLHVARGSWEGATWAVRELGDDAIVRVPRSAAEDFPLSFAQQRLWLIDQLEPGNPAYNVASAVRLTGAASPPLLALIFAELVRRHEVLRTAFAFRDGRPVQVVRPFDTSWSEDLPVFDLSALPAREREACALLLAREEARLAFDLRSGHLLRLGLVRLSEREHLLLMTVHHIVSDGWSMGVLLREIAALYEAFSQGQPSPLPELPVQYADFAVWQRRSLSGDVLAAQLDYWRHQLAGAPPVLELPTDRPRPAVRKHRNLSRPLALSPAMSRAFLGLCRRQGVTPFMALLAAWAVLLGRHTGAEDLPLGSPVAGRNRREIEGLIGFFVNTLVLRVDLSGAPSFAGLLQRVREMALDAFTHQDLPFERLVEELVPERDLNRSPLFQAMFMPPQNTEGGVWAVPGLVIEPVGVDTGIAKFDLTLALYEGPKGIAGLLECDTDLFDPATAERLAARFETLVEGAVADPGDIVSEPGRTILDLPLLAAGERRQLETEWATVERFPAIPSLHRLFVEQARRAPGAPALIMGVDSLTYGELDRLSDRLARRLERRGVGPEVVVGICLERSLGLPTAILGVLKAGGAYLPLDPAYPEERLAFLLTDAGAAVIVTERRLAETLSERWSGGGLVYLDEETPEDAAAADAGTPVDADVGPDHLAYVIYTSGSTGRPRGVQVTHGNVVRLLAATDADFGFGPRDVWTLFHSFAFDFAVWEMWGALAYGGSLVVVPYWVSRSPEAFHALLAEERVTVLNQTPSSFRQLAQAEEELGEDRELVLRLVIFGGEALEIQSLRPWVTRHGAERPRLVNMYGITETTVHVTCRPLAPADIWAAGGSVIGRPLPDLSLRVLDPRSAPLPVGIPGELCVAGAGLARGYLKLPELTAQKFVPDPWGAEPGARLYRSGDLVRRLADGDLEYLGRIDFQVKIRGFRIELGEIEAALSAEPGVRQAVVIAREDEPGDRRLVAYVVVDEAASPGSNGLREALKRKLPEPLIPAAIVELAALPLTVNGKVDRRALPAPERKPVEVVVSRPPATPLEEVLCGIWREVLSLPRVGVDENFFELGGHSLLATQVISRVRHTLGADVPLRGLFEKPTVAAFAGEVGRALSGGPGRQAPPIVPLGRDGDLPLSFAQERLWFLDQLAPGSAAYNIPLPVRVLGALEPAVLAAVLGEVVRRHEVLRTAFAVVTGRPVEIIAPSPAAAGFGLALADLGGLAEAAREAEAARLAVADAERPFDLATGPMLRAILLRLGLGAHTLLLTLHHIAADGWSMGVLTREVAALYPAFAAGRPSPLPELPVQYADFALWQRGWLTGEVLADQLAYWRGRLSGAPALLELPVDRQRPAVSRGRSGQLAFHLPPAASSGLKSWASRQPVTLFMAALAAYAALLARWTGREDLSIGVPIAGRTRRETEGLIGFFVNTLVLRLDVSGAPSFGALLDQVRAVTLEAYAHQDVPFERLVEELAPERSLSHAPLFQVMLNLNNAPLGRLALEGLALEPVEVDAGRGKFDLTLTLLPRGDELYGAVRYSRDLFDPSSIGRFVGQLGHLIAAAVELPLQPIATLPLLDAAETHQVMVEWSGTAEPSGAEACLHQLFVRQAERRPDAVALVYEDERLSFGELARRSGRLAGRLRALGVGPESRVALCAERSLGLVEGLLGVLRAGGAYVPLDPAHPRERLARLLADIGRGQAEPVTVVQAHLAECLPASAERSHRLVLEEAMGAVGQPAPADLAIPSNAAYVIFTSGSTGEPKGVVVEHRQVVRYVQGVAERTGLSPGASFALVQPVTVDSSKTAIYPPLLGGGTLHLISQERALAPGALAAYLRRHEVDALKIAPSHLAALQATSPTADLLPRGWLIFGGEASRPDWALELVRAAPRCGVFNHYGPTEATVGMLVNRIEAGMPTGPSQTTPLGRPLPGARAYLLDRAGQPVPTGISGELYIGGIGGAYVTRGYHGRPGLTAERFVPDAFGPEPGGRLYRTGDLARFLADGTVEFLGRIDGQVKIRGFRIELGEIESALCQHAGVREAIVAAPEVAGVRQLVAYVVPGESRPEPAELRRFLGVRLPEYMVPGVFGFLAELPRSAHGKVDRRALPALERRPVEVAVSRPPATPLEEVLCGIWEEVLNLPQVGAEENFFELGGHSLLATQVVSRVRHILGADVPLRSLFEGPTVAALAGEVGRALSGGGGREMPPILPAWRGGELPLSFAQQRLWFLDQLEPGPTYNIPSAFRLSGRLDRAALAASLREIVRRHETLRTTFATVEGRAVPVIAPWAAGDLPLIDLAELSRAARAGEEARLVREEARRPFDLRRGPLLRARLLRLGEAAHSVLFNLHHIVSDGWSTGVLLRELGALYSAFVDGRPSPLPELPIQYFDFAVWQQRWLSAEILAGELAYWREALRGLQPLDLPTDRPRPPVVTSRGSVRSFALPAELSAELARGTRTAGVTLFMTILAALGALLSRLTGRDDLAVGSPIANRGHRELEGLIGFFVNSLVLRIDLSSPRDADGAAGQLTFGALLTRVRSMALAAYAHQDLPFEKVVEEVQPERDTSRTPLFEVMLILQHASTSALEMPGLTLRPLPFATSTAKFDLSVSLTQAAAGLQGAIDYNADLFDGTTIQRLAGQFATLLAGVAAAPEAPLADLPLLTAAEKQVLREWNSTAATYREACLHDLILAQARRTPDAVAVVFEDTALSYGELAARATRLAGQLCHLGVGPEALVGICAERSLDLLVGLVGVLASGGAYLPLDPAYPRERLAGMLEDARPTVLLVQAQTAGALTATDTPRLFLDAPAANVADIADIANITPAANTGGVPGLRAEPDNLAYVIFTSGSTGRPKGVMNRHRSIVNRLLWMQETSGLTTADRVLQKTPISFDVSVWELFWPLLSGSCLVVARPGGHQDPAYLAHLLAGREITIAHFVPAMLNAFLAEAWTGHPAALRRVVTSGEALPAALAERFFSRFPGVGLQNLYGPTEAAVEVTSWDCVPGLPMVPIGRPIANVAIRLLDAELRPVPIGAPGELYIGGVPPARGYCGRPELTAERFIPDTAGEPGERLYRTGDLARHRPGGEIEFLGRLDQQVKIRGFRVELGEIEAVLAAQPAVREVVVLVHEERGEQRLVAYLTAVGTPDVAAVRAALEEGAPRADDPRGLRRAGDPAPDAQRQGGPGRARPARADPHRPRSRRDGAAEPDRGGARRDLGRRVGSRSGWGRRGFLRLGRALPPRRAGDVSGPHRPAGGSPSAGVLRAPDGGGPRS